MAPRRSVKISPPAKKGPTVPLNPPGRRQKRGPPLKVPSIITISIPCKKAGLDVPDSQKHIDAKTKIALANEVIRSQLLQEPIEVRPDAAPAPKKRGRKKKVVTSEFFRKTDNAGTSDKVATAATQPAEMARKKYIKKHPPVVQRTMTRKRSGNSTVQKPQIKRQKLQQTAKKETAGKAETENHLEQNESNADTVENSVTEDKSHEDSSLFSLPKHSVRTRRQGSNRGKQGSRSASPILQTRSTRQPKSQAANIKSPETSPLSKPLKSPKESKSPNEIKSPRLRCPPSESPKLRRPPSESPKAETPSSGSVKKETDSIDVDGKAEHIESRKTSISSNSNLSWTRDISSSSTTTCVTVASNDFVRFNKKLPVIKLTNIDSEIDKYKRTPIDTAVTNADDDSSSTSDDSSSSDSESDTSSDQPKSNDRSHSYDSPNKVKSLNLSSSSRNSVVTQNEDIHTQSDYIKKDYRQETKKLVDALKKIDLEFRNWLPEGVVASDLNIIKDKLFDILSSEFRALTYCRNLQEIPKLGVVDDVVYDTRDKTVHPDVINGKPGNRSIENNRSNILERDKVENSKDKTVECYEVASKKQITIDSNKNNIVERNKNRVAELNNTSSNDRYAGVRKTAENNLVNVEDHSKDESHKENAAERNKSSITEHSRIQTNNSTIIKTNRVENIRIEINSMGTKKIGYNPIESNKSISKEVEREPNNIVENISDDVFVKPGTSGLSNKHDRCSSPRFSDPEDSSSSEDNTDDEDVNSTPDAEVNMFNNSHYDDDDALSLFAESITGIESSKYNISHVSPHVEDSFEEYVPKPIQKSFISPKGYTYCPTRISDQNKNGIVKTVCEKQNADSTSICKDKESETPPPKLASVEQKQDPHENTNLAVAAAIHDDRPKLLSDLYKPRFGEVNIIFKGYCFFNIINRCQHKPCKYRHIIPSQPEITKKLEVLSDELFIREYVLIRRQRNLLASYGICFASECVRRELTRMLVEIAYDFITRDITNAYPQFDITVEEVTLLYLNHVDLSECEDLMKLQHEGSWLCEILMQVMTSTQNFSRFKQVFLNLTYFMVNNDRTFKLRVAEQILERVRILPYDETLVRALIEILRLTSPKIFENSNIAHFEKQISVNKDVLGEYLLVRNMHLAKLGKHEATQPQTPVKQVPLLAAVASPVPALPNTSVAQHQTVPMLQESTSVALHKNMAVPQQQNMSMAQHQNKFVLQFPNLPMPANASMSVPAHGNMIVSAHPHMAAATHPNTSVLQYTDTSVPPPPLLSLKPMDQLLGVRPEMRDRAQMPPSPDTTHLDFMNKSADDTVPKITRTIWSHSSTPNLQMANVSTSSSNSGEVHENWRNRSIFQEIRGRGEFASPRRSMRRPTRSRPPVRLMRNRHFNERLVTFRGSPTEYPPPGPNY